MEKKEREKPELPRKKRENGVYPPGFKLRYILKGHTDNVQSVAWSPNGEWLASGSLDKIIRLWDTKTGQPLHTLTGHTGTVYGIAWSPNGELLASSSEDKTIRLWDVKTGQELRVLTGHTDSVWAIAWPPNGELLASGSDDRTIRLWDVKTGQELRVLTGHTGLIYGIAWSPNRELLASGSTDRTIRLWDVKTGQELRVLTGHTSFVLDIAWSPNGELLASGSDDGTIRLWDVRTKQELRILEGHTAYITSISFSNDNTFLTSKSMDGTVRIWHTETWEAKAILEEPIGTYSYCPPVLSFHPTTPILVTHNEDYKSMRIWDLDFDALAKAPPITKSVYYTTAKIALVGDSSVGKSGLGYRIAEGHFQVTESTHGQQFWVVDKLGKTRDDGTICEAVLWDFAGQPNFRPIHALFLDDVDLALVLFDPSRQDTFTGVEYWLKQLSYKQRQCRIVLVAARSDVSKLSIPRAELTNYCREKNITGGFILTSAKTGTGIAALLKIIQREIDWNAKPTTTTTETFKRIKDHVLALKASAERKNVLASPAQLRTQLEEMDAEWDFTDAEMLGAVGHLQNHGYVTILRSSSETQSILLAPDLLINLAASYMLKAQANERGLGSLEEARALRNDYHFPELKKLKRNERDTLLNAVTELFLERNICYRESIDNQTFLIFPSLILERPVQMTEDMETVEDTAYVIKGVVENLYPTLVVLLGYSPSFQRVYQWRKQAQYETMNGEICGFKLANDDPAVLELVLYYGKDTPPYVRSRFQGLFEEILYRRDVLIEKYDPLFCPKCTRQQERRIVIRRLQEGKSFLFCDEDGEKIALPSTIERIALSPQERADVVRNRTLSQMRTTYETALVRIKGFLRDQGSKAAPTCFFSYAWGVPEHERQVLKLADDLRNADIHVILDQWSNPAIGSSVARFISSIEQSEYILVIGTPSYREKYENKVSQYGSVVAAEVDLIHVRLTGTQAQKESVLPVLLAGEKYSSFPPLLHDRVYGDFTQEESYFVTLFNLVLTLYHIPFDDTLVRDLQIKLKEDAEALLTAFSYLKNVQ